MAALLSGNALVSSTKLFYLEPQARLVLGWVMVCRWARSRGGIKHLDT